MQRLRRHVSIDVAVSPCSRARVHTRVQNDMKPTEEGETRPDGPTSDRSDSELVPTLPRWSSSDRPAVDWIRRSSCELDSTTPLFARPSCVAEPTTLGGAGRDASRLARPTGGERDAFASALASSFRCRSSSAVRAFCSFSAAFCRSFSAFCAALRAFSSAF